MRRLAALVLILGLVGFACGSDPDDKSDIASDGAQVSIPPASGSAAPASATAQPRSAGAVTVPGGQVAPGAVPIPKGKIGKGVTAKEITVGLQVPKNLGGAIALLGAKTSSADNLVQQVIAVQNWINAAGGVAGRKLKVVIHETDPIAGTWAVQSQQVCTHFTEDAKVLLVANTLTNIGLDLLSCLAQHDTPMLAQNSYPYDDADYKKFSKYLYQSSRFEANRWHRAYIDGLVKQGFFKGGKVGLARFDSPAHKRIATNVIRPALKAHGITLAEEGVVKFAGSFYEFSSMSAEISSLVLKFKEAKIDRVLFVEEAGSLLFFWLPGAENASYYPRYGLSSALTPNLHSLNHPKLMEGAVGVGWSPQQDVANADAPSFPGFKRCVDIIKQAGLFVGDKPRSGAYECDSLFWIQKVLNTAVDLTPDGIRAAVDKLGTSFESALTFKTRFAPNRHWGVQELRNFTFNSSCKCFRYVGAPYAAPN